MIPILGRQSRLALILRRWIFILASVPVLWSLAPTTSWFAILALAVVCGAMTVHLFDTKVFDQWTALGRLLVADTLLVGCALLGTGATQPIVLGAYFVVVLLATLAADRFKTLLGSFALLGILAALARAGAIPLSAADLIHLPLLSAAALHFGNLGERTTRSARSKRSSV